MQRNVVGRANCMCSGSEEFKSITRYGNHKQTNMATVQIVFKKYWNKGPGRNIYTTILFIYEYNLYCVLSPQCFSNAFSHGLCVRVWGGGRVVCLFVFCNNAPLQNVVWEML